MTEVARFLRDGYLLRQSCAQRIGTGDDHPIVDPELKKCVPNRVQLRDEVFMWNRDLARLMPALLGIRHLIFNLDRAGSRFNHFLR